MLCPRAILLNESKVEFDGPSERAIETYLNMYSACSQDLRDNGAKVLRKLEFVKASHEVTDTIQAGEGGALRIHYETEELLRDVHLSLSINTMMGTKVASFTTSQSLRQPIPALSGSGYVDCVLDCIPLVPGKYLVNVALDALGDCPRTIDHVIGASELNVVGSDYLGSSKMGSRNVGFLLIKHKWLAPHVDGR